MFVCQCNNSDAESFFLNYLLPYKVMEKSVMGMKFFYLCLHLCFNHFIRSYKHR
jgi:hypothetical protein